MAKSKLIILGFFFLYLEISNGIGQFEDITISDVNRDINLQSQLSNVNTYLKVRNNRDQDIDGFYFAVSNEYQPNLSLITASDDKNDLKVVHVDNLKIKQAHNATLYFIKFNSPVKRGSVAIVTVTEVYWKRMEAYPKEIGIFVILFIN